MAARALDPKAVRRMAERQERADREDEMAYVVRWRGTPEVDPPMVIFPYERSAVDATLFRAATGLSLAMLLQAAGEGDADLDILAAVVWMAIRQNGIDERPDYFAIAEQITDAESEKDHPIIEMDVAGAGEAEAEVVGEDVSTHPPA